MRQGMRRVVWVFVGVSVFGVGEASANMSYLQAFKKAYPKAKASCVVCHASAAGTKANLNAYGKALETLKAKEGAALTAEASLKQLEAADADGDGASNGDEIAAGTGPGDPKSAPSATTAPAKPKP